MSKERVDSLDAGVVCFVIWQAVTGNTVNKYALNHKVTDSYPVLIARGIPWGNVGKRMSKVV